MQEDIEPNKEESSKLDKVKKHCSTHWKKYAVSGGLVLTAGVTFVVTKRYYGMTVITLDGVNVKVNSKAFLSKQTVTTIVKVNRPGPPSYVVLDLDTLERWESQEAFAKAIGVTKNEVTKFFKDPTRKMIANRKVARVGFATP